MTILTPPTVAVPEVEVSVLALWLPDADVVLVDVREDEEWHDHHIDGAILLPMSDFEPEQIPATHGQPLVIMCRSGKRSEAVARRLLRSGFTEVYNLAGGILAWEAAGLPVVRRAVAA